MTPRDVSSVPPLDALRAVVAPYEAANDARAWWAFASSFPPYLAVWYLAYRALAVSWWLTAALSVIGAGFVLRTFIVQHDCGHGSFFRSARLRANIGRLCSLITLVPYSYFRRFHAGHHATSGKLHGRGADIATLTVREYLALGPRARLGYRIMRNPIVLFGLAPVLYFAVVMRMPARALGRERPGILLTNLALAAAYGGLIALVGVGDFLRVQLPITLAASTAGMWLFYVQHQFEHTYWAGEDAWDFGRAALEGSSYYALPRVLAWFTGYIGFHHIHHLSVRVPSYRLVECHRSSEIFARVPRLTMREALGTMRLTLWDEDAGRLTGWPTTPTVRSRG